MDFFFENKIILLIRAMHQNNIDTKSIKVEIIAKLIA